MPFGDVTAAHRPTDRRCAYRSCGAALPPPTGRPGNRPKYCQDGRTWGPQELTCKAAEAAHLAVASLLGDGPLPPAGVAELTARLDDAAGPLGDLLAAVTATREQLDRDVVAARAERDAALDAAAADRGARELAERDATQARATADAAAAQARAAADETAAAARAREAAETKVREAERAVVRGEGRLAAVEDRLRRAEQLADEAATHAARLDAELADAHATLRARDEALDRERARAGELQEAHRAELAARAAAHAAERERLAGAHAAALDRRSDAHAAELAQRAAAHAAELARTAALHAAELDRRDRAARTEREIDLARMAALDRALGVVAGPGPAG
ncbi:MAG: hypothetical protein ACT4RN_13740 [Pseudonocardia sp.]